MSTEALEQDTSVADMAAFVAKHGQQEALDGLHDASADSAESRPGKPDESGDDGDDLDISTLQALGLAPQDAPSPEGDDTQGSGTEEPSIDLDSLAQTLGADPKDLAFEGGELKVRTKVDGEEDLTPFTKLREGYQLRQHFTRQNEAFLEQKRQWEAAQQQEFARAQQLAQAAGNIIGAEEEALKKQYTRDWNQLRQDDPGEYAAQVAEYNQKLGEVRTRGQQVFAQLQQQQAVAQQKMLEQQHLIQLEGRKKLAEALNWSDETTYKEGATRLQQYLTEVVGLSQQEIAATTDHRSLLVSEKARRYDDLMSKVDLARKKVSGSHKVPSGANAKPLAGGKKRKAQTAVKRLQKEQSVEAAADAFLKLGII